MAEAQSQTDQPESSSLPWVKIVIWAVIQMGLCLACLIFLMFITPHFKEMFEEFGLELPWLTEFTIANSDRAIRAWPIRLMYCSIYTSVCVGLMFASVRNKKVFKWVAIGLTLLPILLLLIFILSMVQPLLAIRQGLSG